MRPIPITAAVLALAGCGGGTPARVELADVGRDEEHWALEGECDGGTLTVEFEPGRVAVSREGEPIASASYEAISIDCAGEVRKVVVVGDEGRFEPVALVGPRRGAIRLSCRVDRPLAVSVNPIWGDREPVAGASLLVAEQETRRVVVGAGLKRDAEQDWSRISWARSVCRPA